MSATRDVRGGSLATSGEPLGERLRQLTHVAPGLVALVVIAVVGVAISVYLTVVHYQGGRLVCTAGGVVDCQAVTSSAYSVVPGTSIPITIPGMLWFLVSGGLALVGLLSVWNGRSEPPRLRLAQVMWGALGLLFVLYLVYTEIVLLHRICEWCTGIHILTLVTFLLALNRLQATPEPRLASPRSPAPSARQTTARPPAGKSGQARRNKR